MALHSSKMPCAPSIYKTTSAERDISSFAFHTVRVEGIWPGGISSSLEQAVFGS